MKLLHNLNILFCSIYLLHVKVTNLLKASYNIRY